MIDEKTIYLATIPKSGTNMLHYFMHYYEIGSTSIAFDPLKFFCSKPAPYLELTASKLGRFLIGHGYCSGFRDYYNGNKRNSWENLSINPGFIPLEESIHTLKDYVDPFNNESVRIGFVYRNPLDQIVSMYEYTDMLFRIKEVYKQELDSYIKVFYTFKVMKDEFPDKISFFRYEDIMKNKRESLLTMLNFFQHENNQLQKEAFERAIHLTSKKEIQKMERETGLLMSGERVFGTEHRKSHITNGKIGKWKTCEYITDDVVAYLHQRFHEFDINKSDFIWE